MSTEVEHKDSDFDLKKAIVDRFGKEKDYSTIINANTREKIEFMLGELSRVYNLGGECVQDTTEAFLSTHVLFDARENKSTLISNCIQIMPVNEIHVNGNTYTVDVMVESYRKEPFLPAKVRSKLLQPKKGIRSLY